MGSTTSLEALRYKTTVPSRTRKALFVGFPGGDPCGVCRRIAAMSGDVALSDVPIECDSLNCILVDVKPTAGRTRLMMWQISPERAKSDSLWRHFYEDVDAIVTVVPSFDAESYEAFKAYKASTALPARAQLLLAVDSADSEGLGDPTEVTEAEGTWVGINSITGEGVDRLVDLIAAAGGQRRGSAAGAEGDAA